MPRANTSASIVRACKRESLYKNNLTDLSEHRACPRPVKIGESAKEQEEEEEVGTTFSD